MNQQKLKTRKQIATLHSKGKAPKEISHLLNIPLPTIYFRLKMIEYRPNDLGNLYNVGKSKQKLSNKNLQEIMDSIKKGHICRASNLHKQYEIKTTKQAQIEIKNAYGIKYSLRTIQKWFKEAKKNKPSGRPKEN